MPAQNVEILRVGWKQFQVQKELLNASRTNETGSESESDSESLIETAVSKILESDFDEDTFVLDK